MYLRGGVEALKGEAEYGYVKIMLEPHIKPIWDYFLPKPPFKVHELPISLITYVPSLSRSLPCSILGEVLI